MEIDKRFDEFRENLIELIANVTENNNTNITDSTFQLKKINTTMNELRKNNIPVPDELIQLKLSLSGQIDKVKDSERVRKELIKFLEMCTSQLKELAAEKPIKKEKSKKTIIKERVSLADLINAVILPANIELYAYYKNNRFSATLLNDGSLEMIVKKKKKVFKTHRAAAFAITNYHIDAWKFWKLDFEGKPLTLDDYRKKYFKKQKEENITSINADEFATEI